MRRQRSGVNLQAELEEAIGLQVTRAKPGQRVPNRPIVFLLPGGREDAYRHEEI